MPSSSAWPKPAVRTSSAIASSCSRCASWSSAMRSQPSQLDSSAPVQTLASSAHRRPTLPAASHSAIDPLVPPHLRGTAAIANAKVTYQRSKAIYASERWSALAEAGAQTQRLLWASTSAKDPAYRDVVYVEELIGPDTVNTMPLETIRAFQDHGEVRGDTLLEGIDEARALFDELERIGVDYDDVTDTLEEEGVEKFAESFDELLEGIRAKQGELVGAA